jgi:tRNA U34 2-thiouridine synthase MnmA/TrmU
MSARVLLLFSGGLDSLLAARLLKETGSEVEAIHFITPFTGSMDKLEGEGYLGEWGIPVRRVLIGFAEFRPLLETPPYGFGRALNACIDCKILFMRKAKQILLAEGFDAIASGEVLGERPMSQNRQSLDIIEREAGLQGLLLRPLSAQLLPETEVEKKGLVDRSKLMAIEGRGRKPQLALAERWGITEFATPAGGCLLTEPQYSNKLGDLLDRPGEATDETVGLLKTGRHFRYPGGPKLIVGRNQEENERLLAFAEDRGDVLRDVLRVEVRAAGSPIGLLFTGISDHEDERSVLRVLRVLRWAAGIVARYSDARAEPQVEVTWWGEEGTEQVVTVKPATDEELEAWRL